jgi:hypothetical protein
LGIEYSSTAHYQQQQANPFSLSLYT